MTLELKALVEKEFEDIKGTPISEYLVRGKPQLTQENLVENALKEHEWGTFLDILEGDWSSLEEDSGSEEFDEE